jgi:hypothetical protein
MNPRLPMTFSKLHAKALREQRLSLVLSPRLRNRLRQVLCEYNEADLIRGLEKAGILDDLPTKLRRPFQTKVLQTVPFMRNELAGHGQGQEVLPVSRELAELCLHFAGSLILFCVRRHLALNPPEKPPASTGHVPQEDDLPS